MKDPTLPRSVYAIRCKVNGKMYIGSSANPLKRFQQHFCKSSLDYMGINPEQVKRKQALKNDFETYGLDGFELYIIEEGIAPEDILERESYYTRLYKTYIFENGYNYKVGNKIEKGEVTVINGLPPAKV